MTVIVRPAAAADVEAIVNVGRVTWPAAYTAIAGEDYVSRGLAAWWDPADIAQAVRGGRALVAVAGEQVVGVATYSVADEVLDLWKLYVLPQAQGTGAGSALLTAVVEGPGAAAREIRLAHLDGNDRARAF
ncbi:GNAT family N-acetyltransferase [Nocardioides sp. R1-1]|uniref:GNAT family N-acetyltransferase n=1 Tax=Nocardioides sp. R1-1 TaxID=3383502 RepID=UPI0038CF5937